jgi:putative nucleotidyltransferase with HDIG domain
MRSEGSRSIGITGAALGAWAVTAALWAADALRRRRAMHLLHRRGVELLLNALTADDPETALHCRRVADLSYAMGRAAGMRGRRLRVLRIAALLHDIGKIDDRFFRIVHSSEPLSGQDRARMRHHPQESANILAPLEGEHPGLARIVRGHHERWDGSGYPEGLAGEGIPLESRIIALADAFDAMTQSRRYRDAMGIEEALDELHADAGSHFDPSLVELTGSARLRRAWSELFRSPFFREVRPSGERTLRGRSDDRGRPTRSPTSPPDGARGRERPTSRSRSGRRDTG